ncbi:MAG: hypothetical protein LBB38_04180 [Puniceicoccales bacterium]|nr:hypothetical protein [Puniceicoccales bacterium]
MEQRLVTKSTINLTNVRIFSEQEARDILPNLAADEKEALINGARRLTVSQQRFIYLVMNAQLSISALATGALTTMSSLGLNGDSTAERTIAFIGAIAGLLSPITAKLADTMKWANADAVRAAIELQSFAGLLPEQVALIVAMVSVTHGAVRHTAV